MPIKMNDVDKFSLLKVHAMSTAACRTCEPLLKQGLVGEYSGRALLHGGGQSTRLCLL
jgi:hypothetical protein